MTTAADVLNVARGELGYVETPNNITKYWADLDQRLQGQPWCGGFVSWCFRQAGAPLPAIDKPYGIVFCPDAVTWARGHGQAPSSPQPGDVVLYGTGGYAVHTGIVEQVVPGGVVAIEGNTSSGTAGSQTNGGGVYRRTRPASWIVGYLRPTLTAPAPAPAPPAPAPVPVLEEDDMIDIDPQTGGLWTCAPDGGVFAEAGARYLGSLPAHPDWHAGGSQANGPAVAFRAMGDGYTVFTRDPKGVLHPYHFPGDGSLK